MASKTELQHLKELVEEHAGALPGVSTRKMFGCEAFFREGSIFGLVWKDGRIGLKFQEDASLHQAMGLKGADPWSPGRATMSHWVLMPESMHDDTEALGEWVVRAHAQTVEKPPKKPKMKKTAAAKTKRAPPKKKPPARPGRR